MELKVRDVVEFKKYEDMTDNEKAFIIEEIFPKYGKVAAAVTVDNENVLYFYTEDSQYIFSEADVVRILKHEEPECFIVKEDRYDLYIGGSGDLVSSKDRAKIYESCEDANADAAYMCLSRWDVIPYDD